LLLLHGEHLGMDRNEEQLYHQVGNICFLSGEHVRTENIMGNNYILCMGNIRGWIEMRNNFVLKWGTFAPLSGEHLEPMRHNCAMKWELIWSVIQVVGWRLLDSEGWLQYGYCSVETVDFLLSLLCVLVPAPKARPSSKTGVSIVIVKLVLRQEGHLMNIIMLQDSHKLCGYV